MISYKILFIKKFSVLLTKTALYFAFYNYMYYSKIYIFYGRYLKHLNMIILPLTITRRSVCVKHISRRTLAGLCSIHFCTLFILTCLLLCRVALSLRFKSKLWRQNCFKFFFLSTILQNLYLRFDS